MNAGSDPKESNSSILPGIYLDAMKHLNFWMLAFVVYVMGHALSGFVNQGSALSFLMKAEYIPGQPYAVAISTGILYCCLLLVLSLEPEPGVWYVIRLIQDTFLIPMPGKEHNRYLPGI